MGKIKYYAVRVGKAPGVYKSWEECKKMIDGYSNAEYKSFGTKEDAEAFVKNEIMGQKPRETDKDTNAVIAYVDGSYSDIAKRYSYGCILIMPSGEILRNSGSGDDPRALSVRNVAGELQGAMYAVKKVSELGYKRIIIRHDYVGIAKWYSGEWKAKDDISKIYVEYLIKYQNKIEIFFEKVIAHSGDKYNDEADLLAKSEIDRCISSKNGESDLHQVENKEAEYESLFRNIMSKNSKTKNEYSIIFKNMNITESKLKKFAKDIWTLDNNKEEEIDIINLNLYIDCCTVNVEITSKLGNKKIYTVKI